MIIPAINLYEEKGKLIAETSVPGIDPKKINIFIEDNVLIIQGESEKISELEDKNYYRKEVQYGSFHRSVRLPFKVLEDQARADYQDGLLRIKVPKAPQSKTKKIKIKLNHIRK
ncbi:Hsp20/alpha crystallin family protein [Patescibacteria group bacterium]|nr:Hsp20/alpha crystallin family protein [Patescibacteria group bacterium]